MIFYWPGALQHGDLGATKSQQLPVKLTAVMPLSAIAFG